MYYYLTGYSALGAKNVLEFATWLVEQEKSKMAIDFVKFVAAESPDAVLWDWLNKREVTLI